MTKPDLIRLTDKQITKAVAECPTEQRSLMAAALKAAVRYAKAVGKSEAQARKYAELAIENWWRLGKEAGPQISQGQRVDLSHLGQVGWSDFGVDRRDGRRAVLLAKFVRSETSLRKLLEAQSRLPMIRTFVSEIERQSRARQREKDRRANQRKIDKAERIDNLSGVFTTIVIDPPWDWGDEGDVDQMGRARPDYSTMTLDEIRELPVDRLADSDAHLYLWITNRSLPKGFGLLNSWNFRYVTCLTWAKPSYGMGNYFRGSTEHILFAVRGSLPLQRKDVGTWHAWDRPSRRHSSKPVGALDLIESCSPGPYLEMFSRHSRDGWSQWGEGT